MKKIFDGRWLIALGFLAVIGVGAGCAATDDEYVSERPWNAPKSWENGVPQAMQQRR